MRARFQNPQEKWKSLTYLALPWDTQTNYHRNVNRTRKPCTLRTHVSALQQTVGEPESSHCPHHLLISQSPISMRNHPVRRQVPEIAICLLPRQKKMSNFVKTSSPTVSTTTMRTWQMNTLVRVALISPGHWLYSPACSYEAEAVKVTADSICLGISMPAMAMGSTDTSYAPTNYCATSTASPNPAFVHAWLRQSRRGFTETPRFPLDIKGTFLS